MTKKILLFCHFIGKNVQQKCTHNLGTFFVILGTHFGYTLEKVLKNQGFFDLYPCTHFIFNLGTFLVFKNSELFIFNEIFQYIFRFIGKISQGHFLGKKCPNFFVVILWFYFGRKIPLKWVLNGLKTGESFWLKIIKKNRCSIKKYDFFKKVYPKWVHRVFLKNFCRMRKLLGFTRVF